MPKLIHLMRCSSLVLVLPPVMAAVPAASQKVITSQACKARGGVLEARGLLGSRMCVIAYKDAGASCRGKRDCQGRCLAAPGQPIVTRPLGSPAKGICQADNSPFGCRADIEDGKISSHYVCTD